MPKAKPTSINVVRIEAGTWERDHLLKPVADIAQTVQLLKTAGIVVVCAGVGMAGYAAYWFLRGLNNTAQDIATWWDGVGAGLSTPLSKDSFRKDPDKPTHNKDGTPRNIFGLPGWGIWPGVI